MGPSPGQQSGRPRGCAHAIGVHGAQHAESRTPCFAAGPFGARASLHAVPHAVLRAAERRAHLALAVVVHVQAWNQTGDVYAVPGEPVWIAEMYGYSFGCSRAGVWHITDPTFQLYPGYETSREHFACELLSHAVACLLVCLGLTSVYRNGACDTEQGCQGCQAAMPCGAPWAIGLNGSTLLVSRPRPLRQGRRAAWERSTCGSAAHAAPAACQESPISLRPLGRARAAAWLADGQNADRASSLVPRGGGNLHADKSRVVTLVPVCRG